MNIRKARPQEMDSIMDIIAHARSIMRANGNASQWINGYPSRELMLECLDKGELFVCISGREPAGVFCFAVAEDPNYNKIEGAWLNEAPYGVIHRLATNGQIRGVAAAVLHWCFEQHPNIRVDTHRDNTIMQHIFEKMGYSYCGIIYVSDGTPGLAYQKVP